MNFLCPNHRLQFENLSLKDRKDLWLSWMKRACECSEKNQWQGVLSFSGSAFDLACIQGSQEGSLPHVELTLSAILVSRVLYDLANPVDSERIIFRALEHLLDGKHHDAFNECCSVEECVSVLMNSSRQAEFFSDYLNWSTSTFARRDRASVNRTLH